MIGRTDIVVLALAAMLTAALYPAIWGSGGRAASATVWVDGRTVTRVALDRARTLRIDGRLGKSVIEVAPGRIRVTDSPGRRKLCVRLGWLSHAGESAVCLPNRVVVQIAGTEPTYDAVNF